MKTKPMFKLLCSFWTAEYPSFQGHRDKNEHGCSRRFFITSQEVAALAEREQFLGKGEEWFRIYTMSLFRLSVPSRRSPITGEEKAFISSALHLSWCPLMTETCLHSQHSCFFPRETGTFKPPTEPWTFLRTVLTGWFFFKSWKYLSKNDLQALAVEHEMLWELRYWR